MISVLTPVYNVEKYLQRCIESILSQTYNDLELILIDDGSTDSSGKICDEYAERDSRIRVFHRLNHGISASREFAIQHAAGSFIQFIDSDDWVEPEMLEHMYNEVCRTEADIIGCGFIEEFKNKTIRHDSYYSNLDEFRRDVIGNNWGVLWKILFRKGLLEKHNIHFPQGVDGGEDYYVVVNLLLATTRVRCVHGCFYHYNRMNSNSFITKFSNEKILYQIKATNLLEKRMTNEQKYNYQAALFKRKMPYKVSLLRLDFFYSYSLYPEIDKWALVHVNGIYNKFLFLFCLIFNVIHSK